MFVPHSDKKVYNLHINVFSLFCIALLLTGILGSFIWYTVAYSDARNVIANKNSSLQEAQANLDDLRGESSELIAAAKDFRTTLNKTLQSLSLNRNINHADSASFSGDISSFLAINGAADDTLKEADDVNQLSLYLSEVTVPVQDIGGLITSQKTLLADVPSIWPIKGGIGHISQMFGQNPNPFTKQYYIHRGLDLSTYRQGDPILATADGQVVTVDVDPAGFGNYVIIKHKYGFYTRYAHMQSFAVSTGQQIKQGDVIGKIGNTGLSTGPHLHYEVHIGSDVVDPLNYATIRSNISNGPASR